MYVVRSVRRGWLWRCALKVLKSRISSGGGPNLAKLSLSQLGEKSHESPFIRLSKHVFYARAGGGGGEGNKIDLGRPGRASERVSGGMMRSQAAYKDG